MFVFLLSSLVLLLIGSVFTLPEVCNPIECFHVLDTFFQPSDSESSCQKVTNLERCVNFCTENKMDNYFLKGLAELKIETCRLDQGLELENKCGNKHKFRLISCIYEKFHLEAEDPNANLSQLMCRGASDGQFCDEDSLPMCSDHQSFLSGVLLVKLFDPLRKGICSFSIEDIYDLKLKPSAFMKDYNSLAECLDVSSPYITDCIPKKWIATNIQQNNMLCSNVQSFFNCVEGVVEKKCSTTQKTIFTTIRQPVFSYLLPHCAEKQKDSSPLKPPVTSKKFLNEVYSDSAAAASAPVPLQNKSEIAVVQGLNKVYSDPSTTTFSPPNISEVMVVHQHVIITMTYKDKNAANQIYVCCYLIVMAVLFTIGKEL